MKNSFYKAVILTSSKGSCLETSLFNKIQRELSCPKLAQKFQTFQEMHTSAQLFKTLNPGFNVVQGFRFSCLKVLLHLLLCDNLKEAKVKLLSGTHVIMGKMWIKK